MTPWLALLAFVVLVAVLAILGSSRTRGRGCCAPADPAADRRMHDPARASSWPETESRAEADDV